MENYLRDAAKRRDYLGLLFSLIPDHGESIGNVSLREQLRQLAKAQGEDLSEEDYWQLRNQLIEEGKVEQGRGRGGSVHRIIEEIQPPPPKAEADLYKPFERAIVEGYVPENRIKRFTSEITAAQGRRVTGGKWTRPDITLFAVRSYAFTPGKRLEVVTFEVKPNLEQAFEGVFEALAHSVFSHHSFLAVDVKGYDDNADLPDERIYQECKRLGVGYMLFDDPGNFDTFDIVLSAPLRQPDPDEVDRFITTQLSSTKQAELRELLH